MASTSSRSAALLALCAVLAPPGAPPAGAATVRDAVGRTVTVPEAPRRIVSLAPNLTEILFALGLGDRTVGVTNYCDWPPEARAKQRIGGFINPSIEAIVALAPDLVLATADGNRPEDVHRLDALGIAVYTVDTRSIDDVLKAVGAVGAITGTTARAEEIAADLGARRRRVAAAVATRPPVTVFAALDRAPLVSAASGTFVDELIRLAGGRNIAGDSPVKYPVFSLERLFEVDPEAIVDATGPGALDAAAVRRLWEALPGAAGLRAVRAGRILAVGEGNFFRPGPRIVDSLETLAAYLHPGALAP